jgi:tripartite motif-containing protein 71
LDVISLQILDFFAITLVIGAFIATSSASNDLVYSFIGKWGSKGSADGEFITPHTLAFDGFGNAYITDTDNQRVQKFSSDGKFITKWGTKGSGDGQFILPLGIDIDSSNRVYVIDQGKSSVELFTSNGTFIPPELKPRTYGASNSSVLEDVELDQSDRIYITDRGEQNIKIYASAK